MPESRLALGIPEHEMKLLDFLGGMKVEIGKEIPKKDFKKWLKALRSGEYSQTKYRLQDQHGYCCLGLGCKVLISESEIKYTEEKYLDGVIPCNQEASPEWLDDIRLDLDRRIGRSIESLNDEENLTFEEIADVLEEVYLNKTLDWSYL